MIKLMQFYKDLIFSLLQHRGHENDMRMLLGAVNVQLGI